MSIKSTIEMLQIASENEIQSIKQLITFLMVAQTSAPSISVLDLAGTDLAESKEYKAALSRFQKLADGSACRGRDGLKLLQYAEEGRNRRVHLTKKGEKLRDELFPDLRKRHP